MARTRLQNLVHSRRSNPPNLGGILVFTGLGVLSGLAASFAANKSTKTATTVDNMWPAALAGGVTAGVIGALSGARRTK